MAKKHSGETVNLDLDDGVGEKKEDGKSQEWENNSRDGRPSLPSEVFLGYFFRYFFRYFLSIFSLESYTKILFVFGKITTLI